MSFDHIADMLTRIRNAQQAGKADVRMPASKMKLAIAQLLYKNGYLEEVSLFSEGDKNYLRLRLKYESGIPAIKGLRRVSRQGQRIYIGKDRIPTVRSGHGIAILTTSKGVLTGVDAKKENIGGELLCEVW